jgi:hypothetical protein
VAGLVLKACRPLTPGQPPRALSSTPSHEPTPTFTPYPTLEPFQIQLQAASDPLPLHQFLGFGAEWDSRSYLTLGVTEEDYQVIFKRIKWMRLPIVRMMILLKWYCGGPGAYRFNSPDMKVVYKHLDFCQQQGISVLLTDWGCELDWLRVDGIENVADPNYAEAIGRCLDHLLNKKTYTCIKYFVFGNEPDYEVKDWERWKQGVENVHDKFAELGMDKQIEFIGPDIGGDEAWFTKSVDGLKDVFSGYDIHHYADGAKMRRGMLEEILKPYWDYVSAHDPRAAQKPCLITEAGLWNGSEPPYGNQLVNHYIYGVVMADYALQAVSAGTSSICAWMLDDNSHEGFYSGMWKNRNENMQLRPWFYTWSLLCRLFPPDSTFLRVPKIEKNVRMLAARTPHGGWSLCIVNREDAPAVIELSLPVDQKLAFQRYEYSEWSTVCDENGFPLPVNQIELIPDQAVEILCQANGVLFLSSI